MGATAIPAERHDGVDRARAEMFAAFVGELNRAEVPYCLLSGYENYPDPNDTDVDFMVGPQDAVGVPRVLRAAARQTGASLVQVLQHETTAWYFVLAKQVGSRVAYLHPDCSTDYRREGRLWLRSREVLMGRRRLGKTFVPAKPDEFVYYVIKKVLKQEIDEAQLHRLKNLYVASPEECAARMRRFWSAKSVSAFVSAMLSGNVWRVKWEMPALLGELQTSPRIGELVPQAIQRVHEGRRLAQRVIRPTGLVVCISGGSGQQRDALAAGLEANLRPAFRRTTIIDAPSIASSIRHWVERVQSTLVIRKIAAPSGTALERHQLCFELSGVSPDLVFTTRIALKSMAGRV